MEVTTLRTATKVGRNPRIGQGAEALADKPQALLVGRHRLFRECLAALLEGTGRVSVWGHADDLAEAVQLLDGRPPDLALVDLGAEAADGFAGLRELARHGDGLRVVVLGLSGQEEDLLRCIEAGAAGYVLQDSPLEDLTAALERVLAGEVFCSPRVAYSMFRRLGELARAQRRRRQVEALNLTPREMEVLRWMAQGLTNRQIAGRVCLSIYTVKNHVHNVLEKLGAEHREAAVEVAYRRGWLPDRRSPVS